MTAAVKLGQYVKLSTRKNKGLICTDVYSVTNSAGFIPSEEYFSKEVFSKELNGYKLVPYGMIAYNPSRINVGSVAVQDKCDLAIVSPLYVVFEVDVNSFIPEYVYRFLKSRPGQLQIAFLSSGTVRNNLKFDALCRIDIPHPDLSSQKRVIEALGSVEDQIEGLQTLLKKLDEMVKSEFVEMFGDPAANTYGLPVQRLTNLGVLERGKSKHRPRNAPELRGGPNGPYPLVQTGDVAKAGLYLDSYEDTYTELGLQQSKMWPSGTFCITIAANIAQTSILAMDACFPDSVVGFTPGEAITNVFLHYWFSFFQGILEEQAPQAAQKNINLKILSELSVITPPIVRQQEFAAFVAQVDKSKFAVRQSIEQLEILKAKLEQEYFS